MSVLDTMRHDALHNFTNFNKPINIIGCGATGSYTAVQLYKLGIPTHLIHLWDGDIVESHNIANQYFNPSDIGKNKAEALTQYVPGAKAHPQMVEKDTRLMAGYSFILTDTMSSRKDIFEGCIENKFGMYHVFETRLDIDTFHIYHFDPNVKDQVTKWKDTLYSDDEAVATTTSCGGSLTIGATVLQLAGNLIWCFIRQQSSANPTEFVKNRWSDGYENASQMIVYNVHDSTLSTFNSSWN